MKLDFLWSIKHPTAIIPVRRLADVVLLDPGSDAIDAKVMNVDRDAVHLGVRAEEGAGERLRLGMVTENRTQLCESGVGAPQVLDLLSGKAGQPQCPAVVQGKRDGSQHPGRNGVHRAAEQSPRVQVEHSYRHVMHQRPDRQRHERCTDDSFLVS